MYLFLQILQFELFMKKEGIEVGLDIKLLLENLQEKRAQIDEVIGDNRLEKILNDFKIFQKETLIGLHGKTPQFYCG